jgi:hypothetical protein
MFYRKVRYSLPFINLAVSTTALLFQTTILNPWHNKISKEIQSLTNSMENKKLDKPPSSYEVMREKNDSDCAFTTELMRKVVNK